MSITSFTIGFGPLAIGLTLGSKTSVTQRIKTDSGLLAKDNLSLKDHIALLTADRDAQLAKLTRIKQMMANLPSLLIFCAVVLSSKAPRGDQKGYNRHKAQLAANCREWAAGLMSLDDDVPPNPPTGTQLHA